MGEIRVTFSDTEEAQVKKVAEERQISASEFIRRCVWNELKSIKAVIIESE